MGRATCPSLERAPLMAVMEDLSREKQRWQWNQAIASHVCLLACFLYKSRSIPLYTVEGLGHTRTGWCVFL